MGDCFLIFMNNLVEQFLKILIFYPIINEIKPV